MKGCIVKIIRLLARTMAALFAILFFLTMVAWLLAFNLERQAFNPVVYKDLLAESQLYTRLPELVAEQLTYTLPPHECLEGVEACEGEPDPGPEGQLQGASPELLACLQENLSQAEFTELESGARPLVENSAASQLAKPCLKKFGLPPHAQANLGGMPVYMWMLEAADWQVIVSDLLPADWTQKTVESAIDQVFARLNSPNEHSSPILISLVELKARLNGEPGRRLLAQVFAAQPPCPPGSSGMAFELPGSGSEEGPTELCRPGAEYLEATIAQSRTTLSAVSNELPDEATWQFPGPDADTPPGSGPNLEEVAAVRKMLRLSLALPLLLLGLVALFAARSWRSLLLWWGLPILAAGGLVLALALAAPPLVMGFLNPMIAEKMTGAPLTPNIQAELMGLAQAAVQRLSTTVALAGGITLGLGLALLVGAFVIKDKARPAVEPGLVEQAQVT